MQSMSTLAMLGLNKILVASDMASRIEYTISFLKFCVYADIRSK